MITKYVGTGVLFKMADNIADISDKTPCQERYSSSGPTDKVAQKINATGGRLTQTLNEIKRRAPEARVYVVGYPAILPTKGADCRGDTPLAPDDVTFLLEKEQQLNAMLREKANASGATYIDTFTPPIGHDACSRRTPVGSDPSTPAVRQPSSTPMNEANGAWPPPP